MILFFYSYPKFVYKKVLNGDIKEFFKLHIFHFSVTIIISLITVLISNRIHNSNQFIQLIINGILCLILPNVLYLIVAIRLPEFDIYKNKLLILIKKITKRERSVLFNIIQYYNDNIKINFMYNYIINNSRVIRTTFYKIYE